MTSVRCSERRRFRIAAALLACVSLAVGVALAESDRALLLAADGGSVADVVAALDAGANVETRDAIGATPLLVAAAANPDTAVVRMLLDAGADAAASDAFGWTALHRAALLHDDPRRIGLLAAAGADVDAVDANGRTALMLAAERGREPRLLDALLEAGADPWRRDPEGRRALELAWTNAALEGTPSLARLQTATEREPPPPDTATLPGSEQRDRLRTELDRAPERILAIVREGSLADVAAAIEVGANLAIRDAYGQTPLTYAADHASLGVINVLVAAGADVNVLTDARWTPLMYAARRGERGIAEALVGHGVDPTVRDYGGDTAADVADAHGHAALAEWLRDLAEGTGPATAAAQAAADAPSVMPSPSPVPPTTAGEVAVLPPPPPDPPPTAPPPPDPPQTAPAAPAPPTSDAPTAPATLAPPVAPAPRPDARQDDSAPPADAAELARALASALGATPDACLEGRSGRACLLLFRSLASAQTLVTVVVGNLEGYHWRSGLWLPADTRQSVLDNSLVGPDGSIYDVRLLDEHAASTHTSLNTIGKTLVMISGPR